MQKSPVRSDVTDSVRTTQERRILIDWVNSLDVDSCMLASGVEDLRFGLILCDIACYLTNRSPLSEVRRGRIGSDPTRSDSLHNLTLFQREFSQLLPSALRLPAEVLYEDEDKLFQVLKFWARSRDPGFMSGLQGVTETRARKPPEPGTSPAARGDPDPPKELAPRRQLQAINPEKLANLPRSTSANRTPRKPVGTAQRESTPEERAVTPQAEIRPPPRPLTTPMIRRLQAEDLPMKPAEKPPRPTPRQYHEAVTEAPLAPPRQSGLEITPVSEMTKEHLFSWLQSLNLVRKSVRIEDFPSLCTTGVLFCDLLNRLEGRTEVIKGIERNPKNRTSTQANFSKVLAFLRTFDKMSSRYLWATADLMAGVEDVVWGLIDDIKSLFKSKLVTLDPSRPAATQRSRSLSKDRTASAAATSRTDTVPTSPRGKVQPRTPNARIPRSVDDSFDFPRQPPATAGSGKSVSLDFQPLPVTKDMESQVKDWIAALKLSHLLGHDSKHYLVDPLKNGVLLCELVGTLEKTRIVGVNKTPENAQAVRENVEKALCLLRERKLNIPLALLRQGEKIAQGNAKVTWNLLFALMSAYPDFTQEALAAPEPKSELPYSAVSLKKLEKSLVNWIYTLGVSGKPTMPNDMNDLLPDIRSGVLLCDLVAKVLPINIPGVFRAPKSDAVAASNVRKALEPLRKTGRMSQMFVWKEKEICSGDLVAVLGLLEDLHRYGDGLPARKRGPDYHRDGPYLGRQYSYPKPTPAAVPPTPREVDASLHSNPPRRSQLPPTSPTSILQIEAESSPVRRFRLNRLDQYAQPSLSDSVTKVQRPAHSHFQSPTERSSVLDRSADLTDERLFVWLDNIGVRYPEGLSLTQPEELRNGVLMCQIVEALTKSPLRGYTTHPKTTAAALNNIRKFLEYMRTSASFPTRLFFVEEAVLRGDTEVIGELLKELYKRFKRSIHSSIKMNERVMKRVSSEGSFRSRNNYSVS